MFLKCAVVVLLLVSHTFAEEVNYDGYKLYKIEACDDRYLQRLELLEAARNVDVLIKPKHIGGFCTVVVPPRFHDAFKDIFVDANFKVKNENVGRVIRDERRKAENIRLNWGDVSFQKYMRYHEIQSYLKRLALQYKDIVTVENYGLSYEHRNLTLIRISTDHGNKPTIFVDAGIHGGEWLGPAQALYLINQLIENYNNGKLKDNVNWIIIPLINPDGYEYAHTTDRLWRKTRSKGFVCDGVDPNRNFDFHWSEQGGDKDECSPNYAGPKAFSEPETLALSKVILKHAKQTKLYLSIHTPLLSLLHPWGYTSDLPINSDELRELGLKVSDAVYAVNGTRYDVGSSVQIFRHTAGSSRDYAYGFANVSLSYTVELPPGPDDVLEMPPENILAVVTEMFEGIKVFHNYITQSAHSTSDIEMEVQ